MSFGHYAVDDQYVSTFRLCSRCLNGRYLDIIPLKFKKIRLCCLSYLFFHWRTHYLHMEWWWIKIFMLLSWHGLKDIYLGISESTKTVVCPDWKMHLSVPAQTVLLGRRHKRNHVLRRLQSRQKFRRFPCFLSSFSKLKTSFWLFCPVSKLFIFVCREGLNLGSMSVVSPIETYSLKTIRWLIFNFKNWEMNIQTITLVFNVIHGCLPFITNNANDMTFRWNARIYPTVWSNGTLFLERR